MVARWHSDRVPAEAASLRPGGGGPGRPGHQGPGQGVAVRGQPGGRLCPPGPAWSCEPKWSFAPPSSSASSWPSPGLLGPHGRTLRSNCRAIGRALAAYPEPAPVPLPPERARKPHTAEEISAYLALADAQPTPARAMRGGAVICLGAGAGLVGAELRRRGPDGSPVRAGWS